MKDISKKCKSQHRPRERAGYYTQRTAAELKFITGRDGVEIVELLLPSGPRRLGSIHIHGRTFKANRKLSHILQANNSISINEQLIKSERFDWVTIYVDGHIDSPFVTSVDFILAHGSRVCYSKAGYEVQVSLPLNLWGINNARKYHSEKYSQTQLFNTEGS